LQLWHEEPVIKVHVTEEVSIQQIFFEEPQTSPFADLIEANFDDEALPWALAFRCLEHESAACKTDEARTQVAFLLDRLNAIYNRLVP
jgi:hypothetical protein